MGLMVLPDDLELTLISTAIARKQAEIGPADMELYVSSMLCRNDGTSTMTIPQGICA